MRVILAYSQGSRGSHKKLLRDGESLRVGRTDRADVVVDADTTMSGVHFELVCDLNSCRIRDLDSRNGTYLNGNRINEATLEQGDQIRAGKTVFTVTIETEESKEAPPVDELTLSKVVRDMRAASATQDATIESLVAEDLELGVQPLGRPYLTALDDSEPSVRAEALLAAAWSRQPWVLDFCRKRAGQLQPEDMAILHLFAVLARPEDCGVILSCCEDPALGSERMRVFGALGQPRAIDRLIDAIDSDDVRLAVMAGGAFTKITGAPITTEQRATLPPADGSEPDEFDEEFLDEAMLPSSELARAHWDHVKGQHAGASRLCRGFDLSGPAGADILAQLDLESRWEACLRDHFRGSSGTSLVELLRFPQSVVPSDAIDSPGS